MAREAYHRRLSGLTDDSSSQLPVNRAQYPPNLLNCDSSSLAPVGVSNGR